MAKSTTREEMNSIIGLTEEEMNHIGQDAENEEVSDNLTGPIVYSAPLYQVDTRMETHTVRVPTGMWELIKKNAQARRHECEYMDAPSPCACD